MKCGDAICWTEGKGARFLLSCAHSTCPPGSALCYFFESLFINGDTVSLSPLAELPVLHTLERIDRCHGNPLGCYKYPLSMCMYGNFALARPLPNGRVCFFRHLSIRNASDSTALICMPRSVAISRKTRWPKLVFVLAKCYRMFLQSDIGKQIV